MDIIVFTTVSSIESILEALAHFHESIHIRLRFNTSLLLSSADFLHQFYITTLHIMNGAYHKSTQSYGFGHKLCWIIGVQIGTHSPSKLDSENWSKFYLLASRNTKWPKSEVSSMGECSNMYLQMGEFFFNIHSFCGGKMQVDLVDFAAYQKIPLFFNLRCFVLENIQRVTSPGLAVS